MISTVYEGIWVDPDRMGGIPCVKGTRFPVAQVLAEMADGKSLIEIAWEYEMSEAELENMKKAVLSVSAFMNRDPNNWPSWKQLKFT